MTKKPKSASPKPAPKGAKTRALTERERKFVLAIVAGTHQTEAYRKAGYSTRGASAGATRLMKQRHILDAIAGMLKDHEKRKADALARQEARVSEITGAALAGAANTVRAVDATELALRREADRETAATISADYVEAALVENLEIAMGRKASTRAIIIRPKTPKNAKPDEPAPAPAPAPIVISVDVREYNGVVANRAIELLFERASLRAGGTARKFVFEEMSPSAKAALQAFRKSAGLLRDESK